MRMWSQIIYDKVRMVWPKTKQERKIIANPQNVGVIVLTETHLPSTISAYERLDNFFNCM